MSIDDPLDALPEFPPNRPMARAPAPRTPDDHEEDDEEDIAAATIAVTFFPNFAAKTKRERHLSLAALAQLIHETAAPAKDQLPWLKLARFGDSRTDKHSLRHNDNVVAITGLEGDHDLGTISLAEAKDIAISAHVLCIIYPSPSYKPEQPKWRILCPFSREHPRADRDRFMARLNGLFRNCFARESWTLSQSYYFGRVDNPDHHATVIDGDPVDLRDDLDAGAIGLPAERNIGLRAQPKSRPEDITEARVRGLITSLLDNIRNAHDTEKHFTLRDNCLTLGGYLHLTDWSVDEAVEQAVGALPSADDWDRARGTARWGAEHGMQRPLDLPDRPWSGNGSHAPPEPPPKPKKGDDDDGDDGDGTAEPVDLETLSLIVGELITKDTQDGKALKKRGPAFFRVVKALHRKGINFASVLALLKQHPEGIAGKYKDRLATELRRAWDKLGAPGGLDGAGDPDGEGKRTGSQRDRLIEVALTSGITLWHDADGHAFATVKREGRIERYRVRSAAFKRLLRLLYGEAHPNKKATEATGSVMPGGVSDAAMNEALPTLEAIAQRGGVRTPAVRVCRDDSGTVWIDLGDPTWRLIAVDATGWRVEQAADVPLVRSKGMHALPVPVRDPQALSKWRGLLNLNPPEQASKAERERADRSFKLIVLFDLVVLWPRGPYPILGVNGEQGSAKSTGCRIMRMVTDPNRVPIRSVPRNPDDLFVTAQHSRLLVIDNVSHLTPELSDVLCGIATGSGKGARRLYTDDEEAILGACNPIIIAGIEELLTRGDLADRALAVMLTAISDDDRRTEEEMEVAAAEAAPGILALLLDAMVTAMKNLPRLKLRRLPRMADFTRLACAAAPAFSWTADEVFDAIDKNREAAVEAVIAADPVATALLDLLAKCTPDLDGYLWSSPATDLLKQLGANVSQDVAKSRGWPKTAQHLSGRLKRAQPGLRRVGILLSTGRDEKKRQRTILIKRTAEPDADPEDKGKSALSASASLDDNLSNGLDTTLPKNGALGDPPSSLYPPTTLNDAATSSSLYAALSNSEGQGADNIQETHSGNAHNAHNANRALSPGSCSDQSGDDDDDDEGEL